MTALDPHVLERTISARARTFKPRVSGRRFLLPGGGGMIARDESPAPRTGRRLPGRIAMTNRRERAIEELYADDPERADALAFGRRAGATRRGFLGGAGLAAATAAVGGV